MDLAKIIDRQCLAIGYGSFKLTSDATSNLQCIIQLAEYIANETSCSPLRGDATGSLTFKEQFNYLLSKYKDPNCIFWKEFDACKVDIDCQNAALTLLYRIILPQVVNQLTEKLQTEFGLDNKQYGKKNNVDLIEAALENPDELAKITVLVDRILSGENGVFSHIGSLNNRGSALKALHEKLVVILDIINFKESAVNSQFLCESDDSVEAIKTQLRFRHVNRLKILQALMNKELKALQLENPSTDFKRKKAGY